MPSGGYAASAATIQTKGDALRRFSARDRPSPRSVRYTPPAAARLMLAAARQTRSPTPTSGLYHPKRTARRGKTRCRHAIRQAGSIGFIPPGRRRDLQPACSPGPARPRRRFRCRRCDESVHGFAKPFRPTAPSTVFAQIHALSRSGTPPVPLTLCARYRASAAHGYPRSRGRRRGLLSRRPPARSRRSSSPGGRRRSTPAFAAKPTSARSGSSAIFSDYEQGRKVAAFPRVRRELHLRDVRPRRQPDRDARRSSSGKTIGVHHSVRDAAVRSGETAVASMFGERRTRRKKITLLVPIGFNEPALQISSRQSASPVRDFRCMSSSVRNRRDKAAHLREPRS